MMLRVRSLFSSCYQQPEARELRLERINAQVSADGLVRCELCVIQEKAAVHEEPPPAVVQPHTKQLFRGRGTFRVVG